ncbi:MAG TPA: alpha/beta hydrolase [Polyangia bacterium]|nr:alpha/beta hydrolase [Polyangia bacterium]
MRTSLLLLCTLALGAGCLSPDDPGNLVPKTVTEDPTLPQIEINGAHLHAETFGDATAPTVVVLHGGPGEDYRSLLALKALADDGYRVVFWDQRGTGLSERFDFDTYTFAGYLADLRAVVDKMTTPGQPYVFIGHSWGAMYATWFINEYGDDGGRLRGAILSDPGAFTKTQLDAFLERYMGSISLTSEQFNDALWAGQFMTAEGHARADYMRMLMAIKGLPAEHNDPDHPTPRWREGAVVSAALLKLADDHGFDWTTRLSSFTHEVLFLRSELDTATPLSQQRELASSYPSADVVTIAGVGHEMIWNAPAEYLARARAYFQAIGFAGVAR